MSLIVDQTIQEMTETNGVLETATLFVESVPGMIASAVAESEALGASAAQLAPLVALEAEMEAKKNALVAALSTAPGATGPRRT